jgi:hypothetical protein
MRRFRNSPTVVLGAAMLLLPAMATAQQPDMSMEVVGAGCNTSTGPTSCYVTVGDQFTVKASLDNLDGLPAGYVGFEIWLNNSAGLTRQDRPGTEELGSPPFWPDCAFPVEGGDPIFYAGACLSAIIPPFPTSTYTGPLMEVDYACPPDPTTETVTMVHGPPNGTYFLDPQTNPVVPNGSGPTESLTIIGVEAVDHFKCYQVKEAKKLCQNDVAVVSGKAVGTKCKAETAAQLCDPNGAVHLCLQKFAAVTDRTFDDQFQESPLGLEIKKPKQLCVPVEKDPNGPAIAHPDLHYTEYQAKGGSKLETRVLATDQFGEHVLEIAQPSSVLVPTGKDPNGPAALPSGGDHFLCYKAKHRKKTCKDDLETGCKSDDDCAGECDLGFESIPSQSLIDQFGTEAVEVKKIKFFCAPAVKTPPGDLVTNERDHLVGYQIKGAKRAYGAHTKNQFGESFLTTKKPKTLYVPALKTLPPVE